VFNPKLVDAYNNIQGAASTVGDKGYYLYSPYGSTTVPSGTPTVPVEGLNVVNILQGSAAIQDFSSVVGTLKSVATFDAEDRKVTETKYEYLFDNIGSFDFPTYRNQLSTYYNQGFVEEVFADAKLVNVDNSHYNLYGVLSKYSQFPSVLVSTTTKNYKTGVSQRTTNLAYDFYSGQVTHSLTSDEYGNNFLVQKTPAYRKYPDMGLGGKNMLVQETAAASYKVHFSGSPSLQNIAYDGLIGASASTWSTNVPVENPFDFSTAMQSGVFRQDASYGFVGNNAVPPQPDGTYAMGSVSDLGLWTTVNPTLGAGWQKNSTTTLFGVNSHSLEQKDINGQFLSTKVSSDHTKVLATVANAAYYEAAYSGAEDDAPLGLYGGGVARLDGVEDNVTHTGSKALRLDLVAPKKTFRYQIANTGSIPKAYVASVWVDATGGRLLYKLDGVTGQAAVPSEARKAGNWYLLELSIPAGAASGSLEVWCETSGGTCRFDDFRIHPAGAAMISYVYNSSGELAYLLNNNNLYTGYIYDEYGRLKQTYRETFQFSAVKTSEYIYHYNNQN
jgi:hypothetical protein